MILANTVENREVKEEREGSREKEYYQAQHHYEQVGPHSLGETLEDNAEDILEFSHLRGKGAWHLSIKSLVLRANFPIRPVFPRFGLTGLSWPERALSKDLQVPAAEAIE